MRWTLIPCLSLILLLVACVEGLSEDEVRPAAPAAVIGETQESDGSHLLDVRNASAAAAIPPPSAPAATPIPVGVPASASSDSPDDYGGSGRVQLALLSQNRVIVHTARISLVVDDVVATVDRIAGIAQGLDGWMVGSDRTSEHSGNIAIRVPAESLREALQQVEALALEVESKSITSQDVTDEYVDSKSRMSSMRATEERLLSFLERAVDVEDALRVQNELSRLQQDIETTQGRLNFLEQTAAYSLIEISLNLTSKALDVDIGGDMSVRIGQVARFRASFTPPSGIDEFTFTWHFGDGTSVSGSGSALRPEGHRTTATVNHVYGDDRDSPYIVSVELRGIGEGGIAEGSDSIEVVVSEIPTIDVFAGEDLTVEEGEEVEYSASFTQPAELWEYQYKWDFGDGSPTATGSLREGATRIEATHSFRDHRPVPYTATLTVTATSDAGQVSGSDSFTVQVTESEGLLVWGWDAGGTARWALRALAGIAWIIVTVAIWAGILSPVIIGVVVLAFLIRRFWARLNLGGSGGAGSRDTGATGPETADGAPPSAD